MTTMHMQILTVPAWEKATTLLHGFVGRNGGNSIGSYAGLNASYRVGDDPKVVSQNVCDLKLAVGIHDGRIVTMKQIHGDDIVEVHDTKLKEAGEADGMITATPGIFLGVLTADCVPILFVAPQTKVVAAVHAGWRGTLAGIAEKAVRRLGQDYGANLREIEVALGPAIGGCCYEVGPDVLQPMRGRWGNLAETAIRENAGKSFIDLRAINRGILEAAGVPGSQIQQVGPCTCCSEEYFSYRREGAETGRQMSVIGWRN
jgi:YfiH family protein